MKFGQKNSFNCIKETNILGNKYKYFSLIEAEKNGLKNISKLPKSLKVLLENLLRYEDGLTVTKNQITAIKNWLQNKKSSTEIAYRPARILLQDYTGIPAVADLAAMREAVKEKNKDPNKINPLSAVDLVIDHSVQVDKFANKDSLEKNVDIEFQRNQERYSFLKWGQQAFNNFRIVPPGTGICHQVNLEYLSKVVWTAEYKNEKYIFVLGQANLSYTYSKTKVILGRQLVETFYTRSNDTKMIPNSFDGVVLHSHNIKDTKITLAYLVRQKLRDHTQAHSILMYGDVNTTSSLKPEWSQNDDSAMHKGLTYTALKASGKTTDAPLIVLDTLNKSIKNLKLNFAAYRVPNLISQIMLEANYNIPMGYVTITPAFRYVQQFDNGAGVVGGASLGGEASSITPSGYTNPDSLDSKMIAAKLVTQFADIKINLAYTDILNEADLVTPWRGFPTSGYTRSMGIYNWKANTKSYRAFISKGSNKSGDYKDALYIFSLLYLDEDTNKGQEDSMYYYAGIVKNLQSYPELQYRVRLGYRDFYNDAYSSKDYLDTRLEFNYLF